jgi:hypothetical protein
LLGLSGWKLITDHKGLIGTFSKPISDVGNARQRNFREKLQEYVFEAVWRKGVNKTISIADCLSRNSLFKDNSIDEDEPEEDLKSCILDLCLLQNRCGSVTSGELDEPHDHDPQLKDLIGEASKCKNYQELIKGIRAKYNYDDLQKDHIGIKYKPVWRDLSIHETGLVVIDNVIVPPEKCRENILKIWHTGHCGKSKSKRLAKERFYWPGMLSDVRKSVKSCKPCLALRKSQPRETLITEKATVPMSHIGSDIFEFNSKKYIVITDRYSSYVICRKLQSETASSIINILHEIFLILGRPQKLRTDRGTNYFSKETRKYCEDNFIEQEFSSPKNPASNSLSESAVKRAKHLLEKCEGKWDKFQNALYEFNNVPLDKCKKSPSQLFFCRRQRTDIPCLKELLTLDPKTVMTTAESKHEAKVRHKLTISCQGKDLPPMQIGQRVVVQSNIDSKSIRSKWDVFGVIIAKRRTGSYTISLDKGGQLVRNRVYIMPDETKSC